MFRTSLSVEETGNLPSAASVRWLWLIPVGVAVLFHISALFGSLVYDDVNLVIGSCGAAGGLSGTLSGVWASDYGLEFAGTARGFYRPLFMTAVAVIRQLTGPNAFVFHLVSLLVFCLATVLVMRVVLSGIMGDVRLAVFAGVFYALHPARVETVSLVMSLPDLVVECCALGIVLCLLRQAVVRPPSGILVSAATCLVLAGAAAFTKESAFFVLPALALTAVLHLCISSGWRFSVGCLPPVGVVLGLGLGLVARLQAGIKAPLDLVDSVFRVFVAGALSVSQVVLVAVRDVIVPGPVVFWWLPVWRPSMVASVVLVLAIVLAAIGWWRLLRNGRLFPALLLAWTGAGIVMLMLLTAGGFPYSQRYLALAPALMLVCIYGLQVLRPLAARLSGAVSGGSRLVGFGLAAYLAVHGAYTLAGTFSCWTPVAFFSAIHEANPRDVIPLGALAQVSNAEGASPGLVESYVRRATALDRAHPQVSLLHNMMIKRYLAEGAYPEALRFAGWSLGVFPGDSDKIVLRAVALAGCFKYTEAIEAMDDAIRAHPDRVVYRQLREQIAGNMARTGADRRVPGGGKDE